MMQDRFELANAIRALAMDAVQKATSGHPGAPMGMADIAVEAGHCDFWYRYVGLEGRILGMDTYLVAEDEQLLDVADG